MTPKEKANKLVSQYEICTRPLFVLGDYENEKHYNKQCALIAVNLRIEAYTTPPIGAIEWAEKKEQYWQEVKQEIDKL